MLKLTNKSEVKVIDFEKKVPIKDIRTQLAVRQANLWISIKRQNDIELISYYKPGKTYVKDLVSASETDLKLLKAGDVDG